MNRLVALLHAGLSWLGLDEESNRADSDESMTETHSMHTKEQLEVVMAELWGRVDSSSGVTNSGSFDGRDAYQRGVDDERAAVRAILSR